MVWDKSGDQPDRVESYTSKPPGLQGGTRPNQWKAAGRKAYACPNCPPYGPARLVEQPGALVGRPAWSIQQRSQCFQDACCDVWQRK